jgi:hypothetical protein
MRDTFKKPGKNIKSKLRKERKEDKENWALKIIKRIAGILLRNEDEIYLIYTGEKIFWAKGKGTIE